MGDRAESGSVWHQAERSCYAQERMADYLQSIAASLAVIVPILQAREERDPLRLMDEVIRAAKDDGKSGMPDNGEMPTAAELIDDYERVKPKSGKVTSFEVINRQSLPTDEDFASILDTLPVEMRAQFLAGKDGE